MVLLLKNLLFTLLVPGTVAVLVPWLLAGGVLRASGAALALGFVLLALGGWLYGWCVYDFAVFGRGTPAPIDAPRRLVVHGPYRYTRNPMYLAVLTVQLAWAVLSGSPLVAAYAAGTLAVFHAFVRLYEEPRLTALFGADYEAYCAAVGRWLPRPRRPH